MYQPPNDDRESRPVAPARTNLDSKLVRFWYRFIGRGEKHRHKDRQRVCVRVCVCGIPTNSHDRWPVVCSGTSVGDTNRTAYTHLPTHSWWKPYCTIREWLGRRATRCVRTCSLTLSSHALHSPSRNTKTTTTTTTTTTAIPYNNVPPSPPPPPPERTNDLTGERDVPEPPLRMCGCLFQWRFS